MPVLLQAGNVALDTRLVNLQGHVYDMTSQMAGRSLR